MVVVIGITECYPKPNFSQQFEFFIPPNPLELLANDYTDVSFCLISVIPGFHAWWEGLCNERGHQNNHNIKGS